MSAYLLRFCKSSLSRRRLQPLRLQPGADLGSATIGAYFPFIFLPLLFFLPPPPPPPLTLENY